MDRKEKKERTISIRCSEKHYSQMLRNSRQRGLTLSEYLLSEHNPEYRRSKNEQKRICHLVRLQQGMNELMKEVEKSKDCQTANKINIMAMEVANIWGY